MKLFKRPRRPIVNITITPPQGEPAAVAESIQAALRQSLNRNDAGPTFSWRR